MRAPLFFVVLSLAVPRPSPAQSTQVTVTVAERRIGDHGEVLQRRGLGGGSRRVRFKTPKGEWQGVFSKLGSGLVETIDGVPPGPIVVVDTFANVVSSAREFDLTMTHLGRPDLHLARGPVPFSVKLAGLQPWHEGDRVVFFAPNARSYESNVQTKLDARLTPGATRLEATGDYLSFRGAFLVDGPGQGDEAWFLDMASATSPEGVRYLATRKVLQTKKLKITNQQPAAVSGKLSDVRQTGKTTMDLQVSDPAALARAVSPEAKATGGVWQLYALPGGDRYGGHDFGGTLVYVPFQAPQLPARARLAYGDPFPRGWGRVGGLRLTYRIDVPVLGTREPYSFEVSVDVQDSAAAFGAGPVRPLVSPVRDPRINGRPAFEPQAKVGLTPEVSWTAPALGKPTLYEVQVYRTRMNRERKADLQQMGSVYTADTRVAFPPGVIANAEIYVLVIQARWGEGLDPQHPYAEPVHRASAPCVTALLSP